MCVGSMLQQVILIPLGHTIWELTAVRKARQSVNALLQDDKVERASKEPGLGVVSGFSRLSPALSPSHPLSVAPCSPHLWVVSFVLVRASFHCFPNRLAG